jgi:hypothetical protein
MKSYFFKRCLVLSLLFSQSAYSAIDKLQTSDVKSMFEEMLNLHVEFKEYTPALARRSIKIFVEQFDRAPHLPLGFGSTALFRYE